MPATKSRRTGYIVAFLLIQFFLTGNIAGQHPISLFKKGKDTFFTRMVSGVPMVYCFLSGEKDPRQPYAGANNPRMPFNFFQLAPGPANNVSQTTNKATPTSSITLTSTFTVPTCYRNDGSISITASGGTPPYTFLLPGHLPRNNGYYARLGAGTYQFTVTDATGQTATITVTLPNLYIPLAIHLVSGIEATGCTGANGSMTVQAVGGTPPYTYSMDLVNYQTSNTFSNLTHGTYEFIAKDANGCIIATTSWTVYSDCPVSGSLAYTMYSCANEGQIDFEATGPNPPYTYSLDGINYQPTGVFTNLTAGRHLFRIKDGSGSVAQFSVPIYQFCYPILSLTATAPTCGQQNGGITATARNGTPPYTYTMDGINFQSSNIFTPLAPGTYVIGVRDTKGEISWDIATINNGCPTVTAVSTDENCNLGSGNNGTITATASNGTAPYQYSLDGVTFQASNVFAGLTAGNYTITVKDANGFTATVAVTVNLSCLSVSATTVNVVCGNHNGQITATASGGVAPYTYSIDGINFQTSNVFTGLQAGSYAITVKDAAGAVTIASATITNTPGPGIVVNITPSTCNYYDGIITITGTGGTPPYQYSIDGLNFQSSGAFTGLDAGHLYSATVKDANGCTLMQAVRPGLICLILSTGVTDETCGQGNGIITATASGSKPPYQYSLDGINFQSNGVFTDLSAGNYTVYAKDADAVIKSKSVIIKNSCITITTTVVHEKCNQKNGSITVTSADGTAPYQFSLDGTNFQSSNIFSGLSEGSYTITVKDAGGLINASTARINNISGPQLTVQIKEASCSNNDGSITIMGNAGTIPWLYSLDGINFQPSPQFPNLAANNYTAFIKDANGCIASQLVEVPLLNSLVIDAGNDLAICEGTGITIPVSSNGIDYSWSPASGLSSTTIKNPIASPAVTTFYQVTAKQGPCTRTDEVTIIVNPAPVANAGNNATICYGQNTQLSGSGGISFKWSPATYLNSTTSEAPTVNKPTSSITYRLVVTDTKGCESIQKATVTVTVTPPPIVFAGNDTIVATNQPLPLKAIDVNNSGLMQFTWSPGYGLNNPFIQNPVATLDRAIQYTVTSRTGSGCEGVGKINIKVYKGPEIYLPNAFSPNRDGKNDVLKPIAVGIKSFKYFAIYNRWGQQIFYSSNPAVGWDGKNGMHELSNNTFVWIAEGVDHNNKIIRRKGVVLLIK